MSLTLRVRLAGLWVFVATLFGPSGPGGASAQSSKQRDDARKLAGEALDLYKAADYPAALLKFEQADKLVSAPTLKLHVARCLDKLDRLRQATEKYREVIAVEIKPSSPKPHAQARDDAVAELAELLPQVPKLTVIVAGPGSSAAQVLLDGKPLPAAALGEAQPIDPGFYRLQAKLGDSIVHKSVRIARGKAERVELRFAAAAGATAGRPGVADLRPMRIAGYSFVGLGAAGLVVGTVAGALVLKDRSSLQAVCNADGTCAPEHQSAVDKFNRQRTVSSGGFIAGAVAGAIGAALLSYAAVAEAARARISFYVSTTGICGIF